MEAYLDNAATTKPCEAAAAEATRLLTLCWGNPSSDHRYGIEADRALKTARNKVAAALGAESGRVFFTSGGTEADNWAVFSAMKRMGKRGNHIITTAVEHSAVLESMRALEQQGRDVTYLAPGPDGRVSLDTFREALRPDTVFASVMLVNNETGAIMPIREMAAALHNNYRDAIFHTDAVQGFGKVSFRAASLGADLISVSAHKIHGVKGAGALYIRTGLTLPPLIYGGGQESGSRSGTEALPAVGAFGAACGGLRSVDVKNMTVLRDYCKAALSEALPELIFLGVGDAPHILLVSLPGLKSESIRNMLQDAGVYVSSGSACAKGHRSHVLEAMGLPGPVIDGAVRVSLSRETTKDEIDLLVSALGKVSRRLR